MREEYPDAGCSPSDCASCQAGCEKNTEHHTLTLTLEDDTEVECAILTVFPAGNREYIALLPLDENGQNHTGEVYLYAFSRTPSGDPMLENIEDDEEYALAGQEFHKVLEKAREDEEAGVPL